MANQKYLAILKQGVDKWNEWRRNHRRIHPDFRGADLSSYDLNGKRHIDAYLKRIHISEDGLKGFIGEDGPLNDFIGSEFIGGADFSSVNLRGADLSKVQPVEKGSDKLIRKGNDSKLPARATLVGFLSFSV